VAVYNCFLLKYADRQFKRKLCPGDDVTISGHGKAEWYSESARCFVAFLLNLVDRLGHLVACFTAVFMVTSRKLDGNCRQ
jgi:hypothetical protein